MVSVTHVIQISMLNYYSQVYSKVGLGFVNRREGGLRNEWLVGVVNCRLGI